MRDDANVKPFTQLAGRLNAEFNRLFPKSMEIIAEPGRFIVATAGTLVVSVIGKATREDKLCYYINDGVYHTLSGILFDNCTYHLKSFKRSRPRSEAQRILQGRPRICAVFGQTCDALDTVSLGEELPGNLQIGDLLYSENIGAYSLATSTRFNGFPPARVAHVNR
jgi:ornithine decarboxylase